jgi:glutaconate CoA-transferase, subunit B
MNESIPLAVGAAMEIKDGNICFVGVGVPSLAAMVAKRTHAPNCHLVYESGAIDTDPLRPPLSTGSPEVVENVAMVGRCLDVFAMLQAGYFHLGLLSAAQVDRMGNLNSTVLGDYHAPNLRMVGSGGAHDIATLAAEVIVIMPHDPRRFVDKVDFITSPGIGNRDAGNRDKLRGGGPRCVLTSRARFDFSQGELTLEAVFAGHTKHQALDGFGWTVPEAGTVRKLPPFSAQSLGTATSIFKNQFASAGS